MKKVSIYCFVFCLVFSFIGLSLPVSATGLPASGRTDNDSSVQQGCHSLDAAIPLLGTEQLVDNAEAVVLYEWGSQTLLYAWNADAQMYPASLVKIMTALIAIEQGNLEETVTVPDGVLNGLSYDAVSSDLQIGEQLSLEDLLYCMMVHSANDAAMVIADHIKGSQSAFVEEMNRYAAELGCTGTHFTNAHGLHSEQQYTTARDAAKILAAAMEYEVFRTIFGTEEYTVPATNLSDERYMVTSNYLISQSSVGIYYDSRVTGGRTGITDSGTRCLAASAEKDGMQLISIVMGCKTTYADDGSVRTFGSFPETRKILDAGFDGFKTVQLIYPGQALRQCAVEKGSSDVVLGVRDGCATVLPQDADVADLVYNYSDIQDAFRVPVEKGTPMSSLQIWYHDLCVAQAELYAMNSVEEVSVTVPVEQEPAEASTDWHMLWIVLGAIVAVLIVLVFIARVAARMRRAAARRRSRNYRRDRRRSR